MSNDGLFTDGSDQFAPKVNAIPLSDADTSRPGEASVGQLVSNATEQMSQLVRSEVEQLRKEEEKDERAVQRDGASDAEHAGTDAAFLGGLSMF